MKRQSHGEVKGKPRMITYDLTSELEHGMAVSKLCSAVAREMGCPKDFCYQMAVAGMVHDIGKLMLDDYVLTQEKDPLVIEEIKYVRMHSTLGYEALKKEGRYSDLVLESVHYHHENYDGTGYPSNLFGEEIPLGARIIRVCDVYTALISDRPYRKAFPRDTVIGLMIEEIKNFDMKVFLAFQRVIHQNMPE